MTFAQFYKTLMKRWSIVVICFLLVGVGAYIGSSKFIKPTYQATALVEVVISAGNNPLLQDNILASQQLAQTEVNLATTNPVLGEVASHYPGLTVDSLTKNVTATIRTNTQLFDITVQDPSPVRAATLANDIAATLIKQQLKLAQQPATQPSFLVVAQPAQPVSVPIRPNKLLNTGAGLLIGLLLGILLAVLLEFLDTRVQTKEILSQLLNWPILGTIWRLPADHNTNSEQSNADAYGMLRANLGFATIEKPAHTLMITSATPDDGKSTIATNLAVSMAKAGKSILLIDANLRHPTLHEAFTIPTHAWGFSNAIVAFKSNTSNASNASSLIPFMRTTDIQNLLVMPSGPLPPNPSELLDSKAMRHFLTAISQLETEIVIFDAPALLGLADALLLASQVDATLLVVDVTRARRGDLQQAKDLLEQVGAHVPGYIINKQQQSHKNTPYKDIRISRDYAPGSDSSDGKQNTSSQEETKHPVNISSLDTLTVLPASSPSSRPAPAAMFEPVPSSTPRMVAAPTPRPISSSTSWPTEKPSQAGRERLNDARKQDANSASNALPSERISGDKNQEQTSKVAPSQQKKDR